MTIDGPASAGPFVFRKEVKRLILICRAHDAYLEVGGEPLEDRDE
jgi:hypothetical protein